MIFDQDYEANEMTVGFFHQCEGHISKAPQRKYEGHGNYFLNPKSKNGEIKHRKRMNKKRQLEMFLRKKRKAGFVPMPYIDDDEQGNPVVKYHWIKQKY